MIWFLFCCRARPKRNPKRRSHSSTGEIGKSPSFAAADLARRRIGAALPLPMGDAPGNVANAKELGLPALVKRKHPLSVRIETSGSCDGAASQSLL
jgi:hypothetical protein